MKDYQAMQEAMSVMCKRHITYYSTHTHTMSYTTLYSQTFFVGDLQPKRSVNPNLTLNRIQGKAAYMRPLKLQASLRARDLARY